MNTASAMTEKPDRLAPSKATIRQLFALSGNLCAFPNCTHLLINEQGALVAEMAHIEGVKPGGERFNPTMTNEERREPSNLLLLCHQHHVETDDEKVWTVEKMREMKATHERRFQNPEKAILEGLKDWTQSDELILPANLDGLHKALKSPFLQEDYEDEKGRYLVEVLKYLEAYKNVPHETRAFLGAVVMRMVTMESRLTKFGRYSVSIPVEDVRKALHLTVKHIIREVDSLDTYDLGDLEEGPHSRHVVNIRNVYEIPFWHEVLTYCNRVNHDFKTYYLDLDFSGLEG